MRFVLRRFGADFKATARALHYTDADDLEVVCWEILHGTFREWTDHKGSGHYCGAYLTWRPSRPSHIARISLAFRSLRVDMKVLGVDAREAEKGDVRG